MYSPTRYYMRVSRAAIFTGVSLTSYRQTRAPPCAAPITIGMTGDQDGTNEGRGDANGALSDHGSSARVGLVGASPAEGLPPGNALLRATRGGALLWAPPAQPPVGLS